MINLADVLAASNGQYDSVIATLNGVTIAVGVFFVCLMALLIDVILWSFTYDSTDHIKNIVRYVFLAIVLGMACSIVYLLVPFDLAKKSKPCVLDVVADSYQVAPVSYDDTSTLSTNSFVDTDSVRNESQNVVFDDDGKVLRAVVVVDDNLNVYLINTDTNEVVQPVVGDSEEVAKLLLEKYQS